MMVEGHSNTVPLHHFHLEFRLQKQLVTVRSIKDDLFNLIHQYLYIVEEEDDESLKQVGIH